MTKKIFIVIITLIILFQNATQVFASSLPSPSPDISDTVTDNSEIDENFNKDTLNQLNTGGEMGYDSQNPDSIKVSPAVSGNVIASIIPYVIIPIPLSIQALLSISVMSDMPTKYPRWFTIESLLSGKFDLFNINFFDTAPNDSSINTTTKQNIAKWFYALRNFAIVALLAVLIYIGILMAISELASDKAKYKKMLISWFASFVILFVIQYMLALAINTSDYITDIIENIGSEEEKTAKYSQEGEMEVQLLNGDGKNEGFLSAIVTNIGWNRVAYAIVYCVLVYYQVKFFFIYLKRFFMVGFLTAIAPLITITYSIDKAGDNQAQAYKNWFKEIMIAIFIQPIHLIFFKVFMSSTSEIIARVPILAIILIGTLSRAESIIRKLFKINGTSLGSLKRKRWQEIMKKRYWNKKRIIISICVVLLILTLILAIIINRKKEIESSLLPYQITKIEDIFKYYNCKLIKRTNSKNEDMDIVFYVEFDREYYTNNKSNKSYFTALATYLSNNLEYKNFALIDEKKEINIVVMGDKKEKKISRIYFNNDMTYFEKQKNEQEFENYSKTNITKLTTEAVELKKLIQNNWKTTGINIGKQECTFNEYDIYFDEGIQIRKTANVVYNIIFTEKYNKTIVNGIKVNEKKGKIKEVLGEPAFYDSKLDIIGYKGNDFYIFFSENEVSIYRVEKDYQNENFVNILKEFMEQKNKTSFVNSLTDIWKDYDSYLVNDENVNIKYSIKGVEISFTKTGGKIIFYENFEGNLLDNKTLSDIKAEEIPEYAELNLTTNIIWQEEKYRKDKLLCYYDTDLINMPTISQYEGENRHIGNYNNKKYYIVKNTTENGCNNIKFISIDRSNPNCELKPNILANYFGWLDDYNFIYSIKNKGIYKYNLKNNKTSILIEGNAEYKITSILEKTIKYDKEKTIEIK